MKLLADLANMDEVINDEDKSLILLSSLPHDDYETFVLTLINDKQSLSYNHAFVNHKLRWKDKKSSNNTSADALTARGRSFNQKDKGNHKRSKFRTIE